MSYKPSGDTITKDGRTSQYVVPGFADIDTVHGDFPGISADTGLMLVDLSNTTQWPHTNTGHVHLYYLALEIDPDTNYRGNIEIGFLTNVDATNGDFNGIFEIDMTQKSDTLVEHYDFAGHGFDCETTHHFGQITANSTLFQTDVNLLGPDGDTDHPSGDGDVCILVTRTAGTVGITVTLGYETGA